MKNIVFAILSTAAFAACAKAPKHHDGMGQATSPTENAPVNGETFGGEEVEGKKAATMLTCNGAEGKVYKGFGDTNLVAGRAKEIAMEGDRFRIKPYAALIGEYTRVMGAVPASLTANASSFLAAPDRWYVDTQASAVTLFTSYRVAYESALKLTSTDPKYASAPAEESATANCTTFARQVWSRLPNASEIAACKQVALVDTASETDVKARWAYALASVLASASFLSY